MARITFAALVLAGCTMPMPYRGDGGQSGVANHPPFCMEDERAIVADPEVAADGFDFAPARALDRVVGRWDGQADLDGTGEVDVGLDIADLGNIVAVWSHLEAGDDDGTGALGAPLQDCPPRYEIELALALGAPPALTADLEVVWGVVSAEDTSPVSFAGTVPADQVSGTLRPPDWPNPELWDREALGLAFAADPASTTATAAPPEGATALVDLDWSAINDPDDSAQGSATSTATATATGTVEPSAMTEPIASIRMTQAP